MRAWKRDFTYWWILICFPISKVTLEPFLSTPNQVVTQNYGDNTNLVFYSHTDNITPRLFILEVNGKEIASGLQNDFEKDSTYIENRITNFYYNISTQSYHAEFMNLTLNEENAEIKATLIYRDKNEVTKAEQKTVIIKILHEARMCHDDILENTTSLSSNETNHVTINLCGNPKPRVIWFDNSMVIPQDMVASRDLGNFKYSYTAYLNREMCGKNISAYLDDTGELLHTWNIDLEYIPAPVVTRAYLMDKCVFIKWKPINICSNITIQLRLHSENETISETEIDMSLGIYKFCDLVDQGNLSVSARSIYFEFVSEWTYDTVYAVAKDTLYIESDSNVGVVGSSVEIPFYFVDNKEGISPIEMFVNIDGTQAAVGLKSKFTTSTKIPTPLKPRFHAAYNETSSAYIIKINELNLLDNSTIVGFFLYLLTSSFPLKSETFSAVTELQVIGGPNDCGKGFPKNVTFFANQSNSFEVILCGNPNLTLQVWIDGFSLDFKLREKVGNKYKYSVTLYNVTGEMCGETLKMLARVSDRIMYKEIKIFVNFTPEPPTILDAYYIGHCAYVNWKPISSGKCGHMKYDVQLVVEPRNDIPVKMEDINSTHAYYCNPAFIAMSRTTMHVRAKYRESFGEWSQKKLEFLTNWSYTFIMNENENLTISRGNDAHFKFRLNATESESWQFRDVIVSVNATEVAFGAGDKFKTRHNHINNARFGTSYDQTNNKYTFTLKKVEFEDDGFQVLFNVISTYRHNNKMPLSKHVKKTLLVVGGPFKCRSDIPKEATLGVGNEVWFEITLCGKPKPEMVWLFNGKEKPGEEVATNSPSMFTYKFQLPRVEFSMCGYEVAYRATGYSGIVRNSSRIIVSGPSPAVTIVASYHDNNSCIYTLWESVNIGKCTELVYQVEYMTKDQTVVYTVNATTQISDTRCDQNVIGRNITNVRIRSIYRNSEPSGWSKISVNTTKPHGLTTPLTTTTSSTTTTTTTTTIKTTVTTQQTSSGNVQKDDDDDNENDAMIAGLAAAGGFILLVLVVTLAYYCYKKNKIAKPPGADLQRHVIHEYDVRNIQTRSNSYYKTTVNSNAVRAQNQSPIVKSVSNENVLYLNNLSYQDEDEANDEGKGVKFHDSNLSRHNHGFEMDEHRDGGLGNSNGFAHESNSNGHAHLTNGNGHAHQNFANGHAQN